MLQPRRAVLMCISSSLLFLLPFLPFSQALPLLIPHPPSLSSPDSVAWVGLELAM